MLRSTPSRISKPRVLFLSPAAQLGGAERCLLDFVWACLTRDAGLRAHVVSLANGPLVEALRQEGATVEVLELPPALAQLGEQRLSGARALGKLAGAMPESVAFVRRLRAAVRGFEPHVVHTNGMKAHLLGGLVTPLDARLIVHLHDFVSSRRVTRAVLPPLALRSARFVANSRAVAHDFEMLAPHARVDVIYNAIDTDYFAPGPVEPEWLAAQAGLAPPSRDSVSFGLIATYARWKGQPLFLEAAKRFFQARPGSTSRFYVIGGPIYATAGSQFTRAELEEQIVAFGLSGRVGLIPFQTDVARVFRALNVVVHASTQPEPFGRTVVEAMSAERPVIVANQGGVAELFRNGVNALAYESGNPDDMCAQMMRLDESAALRVSLGAAGRAESLARYSRGRLGGELAQAFGLE